MYIIIGGDGKEYGPVSGEDVRKWITEGRLNAQSLVKAESDAEFRPLATFPEFADVLAGGVAGTVPSPAPAATISAIGGEARVEALQAVKGPAIALIVVAGLGILYYGFSALFTFFMGGTMFHQGLPPDLPPQVREMFQNLRGPLVGVVNLGIVAMNGFVLLGAIKMLRLQNYGLAMAAAIVAMLPCQCCCLLGLPFGIWALVVLNKPYVKSQFG